MRAWFFYDVIKLIFALHPFIFLSHAIAQNVSCTNGRVSDLIVPILVSPNNLPMGSKIDPSIISPDSILFKCVQSTKISDNKPQRFGIYAGDGAVVAGSIDNKNHI